MADVKERLKGSMATMFGRVRKEKADAAREERRQKIRARFRKAVNKILLANRMNMFTGSIKDRQFMASLVGLPDDELIAKVLKHARELEAQDKAIDACYFLDTVLKTHKHRPILTEFVRICMSLERYKQAADTLEAINRAQNFSNPDNLSDLARCIFEYEHFKPVPDLDNVAVGETYTQKAIEIDDKNAAAYINRGMILNLLGRIDEAQACFETAAKLTDQDHIPHVNLGNIM